MKQNVIVCNNKYKYGYWLTIAGSLLMLIIILNFFNVANAAENLGKVIGRVEANISAISRLMILISYVAGIGFAMAGILQFKAHKDNPTQVPLSKPIVYVCVAAFLLFLPQLMGTAGKTVFGTNATDIKMDNIKVDDITPDRDGTK